MIMSGRREPKMNERPSPPGGKIREENKKNFSYLVSGGDIRN
jgi:hypothetical protein